MRLKCLEFCFSGEPLPAPRIRMNGRKAFHETAYTDYRRRLEEAIRASSAGAKLPLSGELELSVRFQRSTTRNVDIDNLLKAVMDALQSTGVVSNDGKISLLRHCELVKGKGLPAGIIACVKERAV